MSLTKAHNRMIAGAAINVIDYGASPSASAATNTSAFNTAIAAATGDVVIPPGTYQINNTIDVLVDNIRIIAHGATLECTKNAFSTPSIDIDGVENVVIDGLSVNRNQTVDDDFDGGNGIYVKNSTTVIVQNCFVEKSEYAITLQQGGGLFNKGCHVLNCHTENTRYGCSVDGSSGTIVSGNVFRNWSLHGIKIRFDANDYEKSFINNNLIESPLSGGLGSNQHGILVETTDQIRGSVFDGNTIKLGNPSTTCSGILANPTTTSVPATDQNITVTNNYISGFSDTGIDCRINGIITQNHIDADETAGGTNVGDKGIFCSTGYFTVSDNRIENVAITGIEVDSCVFASVKGNSIDSTATATQGIYADGTNSHVYIEGNYMDTSLRGIRADDTSNVIVGPNFYGSSVTENIDDNTTNQTLYLTDGYKNGITLPEFTIASGAITPIGSYISIDTEASAASDDLDTITATNYRHGDLLVIEAANSARTVVVKDSTGNINAPADISLDHAQDKVLMIWDGSNWQVISSSNNA